MNKWTKTIVCALCGVIAAFSLASCKLQGEVVNAYDIAVKNGFTGTEKEWLLSLNGKDGKDGEDGKDVTVDELFAAAKAEGFEGTKLDFIKHLVAEYNANNETTTIAKTVTSVVSIFCGFERTVKGYLNNRTEITSSGGSGVIVDIDYNSGSAYIVTNYHVVYSLESDTGISQSIYLYPYGSLCGFSSQTGRDDTGFGIKAEFIGGAMDYDVALLKVTGSELIKDSHLTAAKFGNSNVVKVGEKTFAVGNSNGLGVSVTSGIVSVDSETITMTSSDGKRAVGYRVMRTDASVNHGNSGGGLFDLEGNLIGITNAKNVEDETDNICYALPITQVKYLLQNIWDTLQSGQKTGYVSRAMLGIETTFSDSSLYIDADGELAVKETFYVRNVTAGSAADGVFQTMDIIQAITIDGVKTEFPRRYLMQDIMLTIRKGDSVTFTVLRDKQSGVGKETVELTVLFGEDDFVKYA